MRKPNPWMGRGLRVIGITPAVGGRDLTGSERSLGEGILSEFGGAVEAQSLHDVLPVGLHGARAEVELRGDLLVGLSPGDFDEHLGLTGGEWGGG